MIVNPNDTTHTVKVSPRFYPSNTLSIRIDSSSEGTTDYLTPSYILGSDNKLALSFAHIFSNELSYSIAVTDTITEEMVYRGLILATTQITQDYSLTANKYYWQE